MRQEVTVLDGDSLTINDLLEITRFGKEVQISEVGIIKIEKASNTVRRVISFFMLILLSYY